MKPVDVNHIYRDGRHYDLQYKDFTQDIPFWRKQARKYGGPILELACGTGRISIPLTRDGFNVTGLDISESMLAEAKRKSLAEQVDVEWVHADCRDFDLAKPFGLIIFPFNSMSHLYNLKDIEFCLSRVQRHLKPNGRFIVDIFNPRPDILSRDPTKRYPHATYPDPNGKGVVEVTENYAYDDANQISRIKLNYKIGDQAEKLDEVNMRIFYPQEIDALLKYNGFAIERKFGDYHENPFKSGSPKQIIICYQA
ncbi:class I SAM-dependent methyltransferase [Dehalococcoidia bacterium]|nr:class I SAM-dependent methyltransferase [Dehalococcoidia bacterium]